MKRGLITLIIGLLLIIGWGLANAAGTVTQTWTDVTGDTKSLLLTWTGDSSSGSVPATTSERAIDGYIILVITNPGSTSPTPDYDITLTDDDDVDVMGGQLMNRDASSTEQIIPKVGNIIGPRWVSGYMTLNLSNNSVASATGTIEIFIKR